MARPIRLEFSGSIYHLTARGNAHPKDLFSDADRQLFMDTLAGSYVEAYAFEVMAPLKKAD